MEMQQANQSAKIKQLLWKYCLPDPFLHPMSGHCSGLNKLLRNIFPTGAMFIAI